MRGCHQAPAPKGKGPHTNLRRQGRSLPAAVRLPAKEPFRPARIAKAARRRLKGKELPMEQQEKTCPCKRHRCERHGDCAACKAHHRAMPRKPLTACEKIKDRAVPHARVTVNFCGHSAKIRRTSLGRTVFVRISARQAKRRVRTDCGRCERGVCFFHTRPVKRPAC